MKTDKDRPRMRVGIIGTGRHGSRYAKHIVEDIDGLHLTAISRRSEEGRSQAEQWQCTWYTDWGSLIADPAVDCIIAAVPPAFNLDIARACAAAAKPLLVEKPLAGTGQDAQDIVELYAAHDLPLTTGQTLRYNSVISAFRQHIAQIGRLFSFSANQRLEPSSLAWHEEPALAGAGVSFHTAVHIFDALRFITGLEIRRVAAVTRQQHNQGLEDLLAVIVEMEGSVVGTVDCSKVSQSRSGRFEFVGEFGQLVGDQVHNYCEQVIGHQREVIDPGRPVPTIEPLLRDWLAFLRGEQQNPVPGEEGLAAVKTCEACLRSAASGQWQVV